MIWGYLAMFVVFFGVIHVEKNAPIMVAYLIGAILGFAIGILLSERESRVSN